jgi:hypothetical protein
VSNLAVAGPLGELHFGHEARFDPVRAFRERAGRGGSNGPVSTAIELSSARSLRPNASFQPLPVPTFPANRSARPS